MRPAYTPSMSSGIRELRVWQDSVTLAGDVIKVMRQGVRRETKIVSDSVMATALIIGSHVADGYARHTLPEQRDSYMLAKRALLRLETELAVARHADILPASGLAELTARCNQLTRTLVGYIVYLDRQITEREPPVRRSAPPSPTALEGSPTLGSDRDPS